MRTRLAVVDDNPGVVELLRDQLEKQGFEVISFCDGEGFLAFLEASLPDLLILDLRLPGMGGLEICRMLKNDKDTSSLPIIMLSGKTAEADRIIGLDLGADDYVLKPFSPRELTARVRAVLRRVKAKESAEVLIFGDLEIDTNRFEIRFKGERLELTRSEFTILKALVEKPGWVRSRIQLLAGIGQEEAMSGGRTVDVHIRHLREKLGEGGKLIQTVRGVGYKIERRQSGNRAGR